jgi:hypothetical protein
MFKVFKESQKISPKSGGQLLSKAGIEIRFYGRGQSFRFSKMEKEFLASV